MNFLWAVGGRVGRPDNFEINSNLHPIYSRDIMAFFNKFSQLFRVPILPYLPPITKKMKIKFNLNSIPEKGP
jgi:hypothetical protein